MSRDAGRVQRALDRINGVGRHGACGLCGSGENHSGEKVFVAIFMTDTQRQGFFDANANRHTPDRWPLDAWSCCDRCIEEKFTVEGLPAEDGWRSTHRGGLGRLHTVAKLLGDVPLDRVLGDVVLGREATFAHDVIVAPLYGGPVFHFETPGAKAHATTSVRKRWAHTAGLREAYDAAVRETKVTVRVLAEGCSICRRTHLPIAEGQFTVLADYGRFGNTNAWYCPACAAAFEESRHYPFSALEIALSDAASVPTWAGLAAHHGVDPSKVAPTEAPWTWCDLSLIFSQHQSKMLAANATGLRAVRS